MRCLIMIAIIGSVAHAEETSDNFGPQWIISTQICRLSEARQKASAKTTKSATRRVTEISKRIKELRMEMTENDSKPLSCDENAVRALIECVDSQDPPQYCFSRKDVIPAIRMLAKMDAEILN